MEQRAKARSSTGSARGSRRDEILAAAVASVVEDGYSRASMSQVARRAGVPRPLVQYYFPTRELMLRAAILKIMGDWHESYLDSPGGDADGADIGSGVDRLWRHMHNPAYRAYQELHWAARTDPALATIIAELDAAAEHRRYDQAANTYASFAAADRAGFTDARAFTTIFLEGLLHHRFASAEESSTPERQLGMLTELLTHYWSQHGVAPPSAAAAPATPAEHRDIVQLAQQLIMRVEGLTKSAG